MSRWCNPFRPKTLCNKIPYTKNNPLNIKQYNKILVNPQTDKH